MARRAEPEYVIDLGLWCRDIAPTHDGTSDSTLPSLSGLGDNTPVRMERERANVFRVTATSQELSVLVAAARMAFEAMQSAPEPPPAEAVEALRRVLSEFDSAREGLAAEPPGGD